MHVDGFRFDLATILGRGPEGFRADHPLLQAIETDPVLGRLKLISEPWDVGPGGYRLGGFGPKWAEWNDRFRDDVRRFWRGDRGHVGAMAHRLAGSSDYMGGKALGPLASVNLAACHDGFTLHDLARYETKHNEPNGEQNRDGHGLNYSRNWGTEGPADEPGIAAARERHVRNVLATVFLSLGVPMIASGDELGRTQRGNTTTRTARTTS
jgi:glycogen operon protein